MFLIIGTLGALRMTSIEPYHASIGRFYNYTLPMLEVYFLSDVRMSSRFSYTYFFPFCICQCYYMLFFAIFVLVTFNVLCLKSVRLKHIVCFSHFLVLNYRGLNLNFLKLAQLLINSDVESNPGPTQNNCKSPRGHRKKIRVFKGAARKFDLSENININVASFPKVNFFFSHTI